MRRLAAAAVLGCVAATGCAGTNHAASARAGSVSTARSAGASTALPNWSTYHRTSSRSGNVGHGISRSLKHDWSRRLDAAVYGEPLVVKGRVIAATENDSVYGLNPTTGKIEWRTRLGTAQPQSGLPCGDVFPLGITGTPAYDAKTGSVFVVAETGGGHHTLWALNAVNGRRRWHRTTDLMPGRDRFAEQQRSALLVTHGRVITTYGGLDGDCGNYVGYVTSTSTSGNGKTSVYAVPTSREAGIWSPAGPVVGRNGNVYVAIGNGAETGGQFDKSDSVTELTPKALHRVALFAPSTWADDNRSDLDLGSSSPEQVPAVHRIVIAGKRGAVYLLKPSLGDVGGQLAKTADQKCNAFGGAARSGRIVVMPCRYQSIRALVVGTHSLHWKWTAPGGLKGSPVIAGNKVLVADESTNAVKVLSLKTGRVLSSISVGSLSNGFEHVFASLSVSGKHVFVGTLTGVTGLIAS